ncbi:hypothetical protein EVAR_36580_1 [Eumeta japonica]|uniref:Uncharacterized protein n=1 Tax=Eumeta variegata TaxID=151549 RepID=A0A4C1XPA0_EUMVA|nr:hypothetical protein EVAR_36580_1 [Eumeta japonica]
MNEKKKALNFLPILLIVNQHLEWVIQDVQNRNSGKHCPYFTTISGGSANSNLVSTHTLRIDYVYYSTEGLQARELNAGGAIVDVQFVDFEVR